MKFITKNYNKAGKRYPSKLDETISKKDSL